MSLRWFIALLALLAAGPAAAQSLQLRAKVDRYEPMNLPDVRIWATALFGTAPVPADTVEQISLDINGDIIDDVEVESAAEHGAPRAVAVVVDGRTSLHLRAVIDALPRVLGALPDDSLGAVHVLSRALDSYPGPKEAPWSADPASFAPTLAEARLTDGGEPALNLAIYEALTRFPLAHDVDEKDETEPRPKLEDEAAFPADRVLYVVGDGQFNMARPGDIAREVQSLIALARRRGVRIMGVGLTDEVLSEHIWIVEALARKTGGTYRRALSSNDVPKALRDAADELDNRLVITAEAEDVRSQDELRFVLTLKVAKRGNRTTRPYLAIAGNIPGPLDRLLDTIGTRWEGLSWLIQTLITVAVLVVGLIIALIVVLIRVRRARKRDAAEQEQRRVALENRKPCPVCGNKMMPEWTECLFCARSQQAQRPMRFRLVGRAGVFAGQALRFDKNLVIFGAAKSCDIYLPDHGVAAEHCGLRDRGDGEFLLSDFNSPGGTWVNGERITQSALAEGDVVRVGTSEFVFGVES